MHPWLLVHLTTILLRVLADGQLPKPFNAQRESCHAELVLGDPVIRLANKGLKDNNPCPLQHMRQYPLSVSVLGTRACLRYFVSPVSVVHIPLAVSNFLCTFLKVGGGNEFEANILVHHSLAMQEVVGGEK